jgi:hypothetical protein
VPPPHHRKNRAHISHREWGGWTTWLLDVVRLLLVESHIAPWPIPFPLTLHHILPLPGNDPHWRESSPPTLQLNPPTLDDFVPRPTPAPPTPQRIWPTLGDIAFWHCWPMLSHAWLSHGNVACQPRRLLLTPPTSQPTSFPWPNLLPSSSQLLLLPQLVPPPHGCPRTRTNEPVVIHHSIFVEDKGGGLGSFVLVPA